jgi:hypothetical protein
MSIISLTVLVSVISAYVVPCISKKKILDKELHSYKICTLHAIITSIMGTLAIYEVEVPRSLYYLSVGYYISDTWFFIYINKIQGKSLLTNASFVVHHIFMVIYEYFVLIYNPTNVMAFYFLNRIFLSEYSVIPLNLLWFQKKLQYKNETLTLVFGLLLLISYFISRIINLTIAFIGVYYSSFRYMCLIGFPSLLLNYVWFYKIIRGFIKHL